MRTKGNFALSLGLALLGLITCQTLSAQVTLFSANFEGDTAGSAPSGWTNGSGHLEVISNPASNGSNTSSQVLTWTSTGTTDTAPSIDLSSYTSGYTFTLSFDLYNPNATNNQALLTGYGVSGGSADAWVIGPSSSSVNAGQTLYDDIYSCGTWQHYSFDFTSSINTYLTAHASNAANFALMFEQWSSGVATTSIDNITLTATAVPEPSTYAVLAGLAALGSVMFFRRRRSIA